MNRTEKKQSALWKGCRWTQPETVRRSTNSAAIPHWAARAQPASLDDQARRDHGGAVKIDGHYRGPARGVIFKITPGSPLAEQF